MDYCPNNTTLGQVWLHRGPTRCFWETVTSTVLLGFILPFGGVQYWAYRKYSTPIEKRFQPRSRLYYLQVLLTVLLPLEAMTHLILDRYVLSGKQLYGYMILSSISYVLCWPLTLVIICLERKRMLPSIPTRGHGLVLLVFWGLAFASENLAFLGWWSPQWFWSLHSGTQKIEFGLFIWRIVFVGALFILGLMAPGLPNSTTFRLMISGHRADDEGLMNQSHAAMLSNGSDGNHDQNQSDQNTIDTGGLDNADGKSEQNAIVRDSSIANVEDKQNALNDGVVGSHGNEDKQSEQNADQ